MRSILLLSVGLLTGQLFAGTLVFTKHIPIKLAGKLTTGLVVYTQTITDESMKSEIVITPQDKPEMSFSALIKASESDEKILEVYDASGTNLIGSGTVTDGDHKSWGLMAINAYLEDTNTEVTVSASAVEEDKIVLKMKFDLKADTGDLSFDDTLDLESMDMN